MFCLTFCRHRSARLALKYPALVSYNKLPWETLAPDSPALHQHLAPLYYHILKLSTCSSLFRSLVRTSRQLPPHSLVPSLHPTCSPAHRMQVFPGMVYIMLQYPSHLDKDNNNIIHPDNTASSSSSSFCLTSSPPGFLRHAVVQDSVSLQYYGPIHHQVGSIMNTSIRNNNSADNHDVDGSGGGSGGVFLLTSEDLQLMGIELTLQFPLHLSCLPGSSLDIAMRASSLPPYRKDEDGGRGEERGRGGGTEVSFHDSGSEAIPTPPSHIGNSTTPLSRETSRGIPPHPAGVNFLRHPRVLRPTAISLYHYFRPHRSPQELTRPLEHLVSHHRPAEEAGWWTNPHCSSSSRDHHNAKGMTDRLEMDWEPILQPPNRGAPPTSFCSSSCTTSGRSDANGPRRNEYSRGLFMPPYRPPSCYLMGLAERLAVRPGDCFGRRSLMWGHWF